MDDEPRHVPLRFGLRTLLEIVAVVAFILALFYYRTQGCRYQFQIGSGATGSPRDKWVIDTYTGQMWRYSYSSRRWYDEGSPPRTK
jgi:hypothetical protein